MAADSVRASIEEPLTYLTFPREHWRPNRTNNPLERLNREIRRRTLVVGAFPDGNSAVMLLIPILHRSQRCDPWETGDGLCAFDLPPEKLTPGLGCFGGW